MISTIQLDARLDLRAAEVLAEKIRSHGDLALCIDAGQVQHLGALCLQVLLCAAAARRATRVPLHVTPRSEAFDAALRHFGIAAAQVEAGVSE
jgi:chemotaxis protein CheX